MDSLKFQPMICGIRWIRLLFIREFPILQLVSLWDYFFVRFRADSDFLCIEELALAMMLHLRPTLMKCKSPIEVIQKVQRFPKIKCSLPLVANAHKIKSRNPAKLNPVKMHLKALPLAKSQVENVEINQNLVNINTLTRKKIKRKMLVAKMHSRDQKPVKTPARPTLKAKTVPRMRGGQVEGLTLEEDFSEDLKAISAKEELNDAIILANKLLNQ